MQSSSILSESYQLGCRPQTLILLGPGIDPPCQNRRIVESTHVDAPYCALYLQLACRCQLYARSIMERHNRGFETRNFTYVLPSLGNPYTGHQLRGGKIWKILYSYVTALRKCRKVYLGVWKSVGMGRIIGVFFEKHHTVRHSMVNYLPPLRKTQGWLEENSMDHPELAQTGLMKPPRRQKPRVERGLTTISN